MTKLLIAYALLLLICTALLVVGVYVLAGPGWALVSAGICFFGLSEVLRAGMKALRSAPEPVDG